MFVKVVLSASRLSCTLLNIGLSVGLMCLSLIAHAQGALVFNTQDRSSDLSGTLQASIYFAQNNVFAITPESGDMQQHLIANRSALLMIKPFVPSDASLSVVIKNSRGTRLTEVPLKHPDLLPKTAYFTEFSDFSAEPGNTRTINSRAEVLQLSDSNAGLLTDILDNNTVVRIFLADGIFSSQIHLPSDEAYEGRLVEVNSNATFRSAVHFSSRTANISAGERFIFKFDSGVWHRQARAGNNDIVYAQDMWSVLLPAKWIQPGNTLTFRQGGRTGVLNDMNVGATSQLIMHTIDLGFLVEPRGAFVLGADRELHREYFQTIPASSMIVSEYQSVHFSEMMMPDGTLIDDVDPSIGTVHEGDMREIGKYMVSHGIDNANYGLHSTPASESNHPYIAAQVAAHHSRGVYSNGLITHGLSGGNGIVTLLGSFGNEISHELGHNYGLGHFPGGFAGSVHAPSENNNSTWGWDADRMRFIPNFRETIDNQLSCFEGDCRAPFNGRSYGYDAMAGGRSMSDIVRFTLHTPYASTKIQTFFESKAIFDEDSPTGYLKWNDSANQMQPYLYTLNYLTQQDADRDALTPAGFNSLLENYELVEVNLRNGYWTRDIVVPDASSQNNGRVIYINHDAGFSSVLSINNRTVNVTTGTKHYYRSNGRVWQLMQPEQIPGLSVDRVPQHFGQAVTTLVGLYDPENTLPSYIYPEMHGAYGFAYGDDSNLLSDGDCQLQVLTDDGLLRFKLYNNRYTEGRMNKFHVNVLESSRPRNVKVVCDNTELATKEITAVTSELSFSLTQNLGEQENAASVEEMCFPINAKNGHVAMVCL